MSRLWARVIRDHRIEKQDTRPCAWGEENEALNRAADMAILSLWYKAADTIADGGFFGRCGGRLLRAMLRRQYRRVADNYPTADAVFAGEMDRQRALEAAGDTNLDELCEPTAKMTAAMLSLLSEEPGERRVLERLGYLLGRYIYMADALDDWEKDKKHGDFNPFLQCEDEPEALKRHARASLLLTIGEMGAALDLLELRHFGPILENIIRLGLPQTVEELQLPPKQRRKREK